MTLVYLAIHLIGENTIAITGIRDDFSIDVEADGNLYNGIVYNNKKLKVLLFQLKIDGYKVTKIGARAFYDCIELFSIALPEGVTSIGRNAFDGCHSLTNITIPSSVKTIGTDAFTYCWDLTNITIQKGSPLNTSSANYPWGASASKIIFEQ